MVQRRVSRAVVVGGVTIGAGGPVVIQSMTNTDTRDVQGTLKQIEVLAKAGCELVRLAVPNAAAADALGQICSSSPLPVVADIHFDHRLALAAVENGVHGLRLNPGNIGAKWKIREVVREAAGRGIPIRVGVNGGSLEKDILEKAGPTAEALVESALRHVRLLEEEDFRDIKISLKSSHVPVMLEAYRQIAKLTDYPLHLGVTEAGTLRSCLVKSSIGIGALLSEGIGDTIRVSLTGDPVEEIPIARSILQTLGLGVFAPELISCPTCGRTGFPLTELAERTEKYLQTLPTLDRKLTVAVMGCVVNGPGEAREADIGVAGSGEVGILFKRGQVVAKVPVEALYEVLVEEIRRELSVED
ncbi:MAG: flavodoxin-dependent (E)-4-hydroxy-3-methylbut-2-enyl-diphosphate synthase [Peptococcaceae bacterium]|nr:flavodoxin-dependent (E)-4-hydroxy-3-methylbut-2-enyl-diphosphate synthase [Peptococcaceae bacterium]